MDMTIKAGLFNSNNNVSTMMKRIDKYSRTVFVTFHLINPHILLYAQIFFEIMPSHSSLSRNHLPAFGAYGNLISLPWLSNP